MKKLRNPARFDFGMFPPHCFLVVFENWIVVREAFKNDGKAFKKVLLIGSPDKKAFRSDEKAFSSDKKAF